MQHSARTLAALAAALLPGGAPAAAQVPDVTSYLIADRDAEVALARTAAPAHSSDSATVLVLTGTGYVEAVRGTNGFTCVTLRSFSGAAADPGFWNPRVRAPHCFNPPAAATVLPPVLERTRLILTGIAPVEAEARMSRAYAAGEFPAPAPGAMAYMLSPRQYLLDADPRWMPHLMFYYDRSLPPSTWGAGGMTAAVIDGSGGENAPVLTLLIPVSQWSDGSQAHAAGAR
ncbi:MAG: hypothetical protein ACREMH_08585 [Gemmatimonadales bacterium]